MLSGGSVEISHPLIMGILNVTPDSFSDGGRCRQAQDAVGHALDMVRNGADIIDIGGQSTRPGFTPIGADEEWHRIEPVMRELRKQLTVPISVDTFIPEVARRALDYGADIINDVTGLTSPDMRRVIADSGCCAVLMHCAPVEHIEAGEPFANAVRAFFKKQVEDCLDVGISTDKLILDVGIGFGKTREQDYYALHHIDELRCYDLPVIAAASRKRVIAAYYCADPQTPPSERDEASAAAHRDAIMSGADIIRVHNVALHDASLRKQL